MLDRLPPLADLLQSWAAQHPRPLPWKGIRDPYRIWLSEVILQQTRVEQGLPYYERFLAAYPTITDLAHAPQEDIYRLWEGLGYYARARNMHAAAQTVAHEHSGKFPTTYEGIRALKGVGDYTAAAIASFAYDLPHAVLDGNVYRILSRWFGEKTPIDSTEGKKRFAALADAVLDRQNPARHNQAMMDFGATWCTPQNPQCAACPMQQHCVAYQLGTVSTLPIKSKKMLKKERFFVFWVLKNGDSTFLKKREDKDIWQNLYEFPNTETQHLPTSKAEALEVWKMEHPSLGDIDIIAVSMTFKQTLTHRLVKAVFVECAWNEILTTFAQNCTAATWSNDQLPVPVPRIVEWYWAERGKPTGLLSTGTK
jgi:A/G-specific adenine glycosylase